MSARGLSPTNITCSGDESPVSLSASRKILGSGFLIASRFRNDDEGCELIETCCLAGDMLPRRASVGDDAPRHSSPIEVSEEAVIIRIWLHVSFHFGAVIG